eukprot:SM000187S03869  [mRNA]  locus=s187:16737:24665:- [translate_table: standard]
MPAADAPDGDFIAPQEAQGQGVHDVGAAPASQARKRLIITKMVMTNFKSYAGVQEVGPFHKSFSSVVGPNGSGKSNVIDAMLFVFGKRAKQLRLNKVSELIHNSTNYQNLDSAEVSVHFQDIIDKDDEEFEYVPNSLFTVTRTAFRNNTSKYFIGQKSSNFTEVTTLLKEKGIDLDHNRFLILQGEVEQIAMMKPKGADKQDEGLLEYLEDIIGSNRYIEKIDESAAILESINEKRVGAIHRMKAAAKEKDSLQEAKNDAEAYLMKEGKRFQLQKLMSSLILKDACEQKDLLVTRKAQMQDMLEIERRKSAQYDKELKEKEALYNHHKREHDDIVATQNACRDEFKQFERKDVKHREDLKHMKQKRKKLEERVVKENARITSLNADTEEAIAALPLLEKHTLVLNKDLQQQEHALEEVMAAAGVEMAKLRDKLAEAHQELEPWEKQIRTTKGLIEVATVESKLLQDKHLSAAHRCTQAKEAVCHMGQEIAIKEAQLGEIDSSIGENQRTMEQAQHMEQECKANEGALTEAVQQARLKVHEQREALTLESSQGALMQAITKAREAGQLSGILGRLGDLGAIDAKYDIAISTACGALDFLVAQTTADAQACVDMVRSQNLGVVSTIILVQQVNGRQQGSQGLHVNMMAQEKQKHLVPGMTKLVHTPEGVVRLFDLVKVKDEHLKPAFFFALRNTVVAEDIDQGQRIAYGKDRHFRRVVTLDGVLYEGTGAMSGGGKPLKGRIGTAIRSTGVSKETLLQAEGELARLSQELEGVQTQMGLSGRAAEAAEKALATLKDKLLRTKLEASAIQPFWSLLEGAWSVPQYLTAMYFVRGKVKELKFQHSDLASRIESLESAAVPNKVELERITLLAATVAQEELALAKLESSSADLRDEAERLQKSLEEAGGEELKAQKARVAASQQALDANGLEISKRKVQIASNKNQVDKLIKAAALADEEKLAHIEKESTMLAEYKELEMLAFAVQEKYTEMQEAVDTRRKELEAVSKDFHRIKAAKEKMVSTTGEEEVKLEELSLELQGLESRCQAQEQQLEELHNQQQAHCALLSNEGLHLEELAAEEVREDTQKGRATAQKKAQSDLAKLEAELQEMKPNMASMAEYASLPRSQCTSSLKEIAKALRMRRYRTKAAELEERVEDLKRMTAERDAVQQEYDGLRKHRLNEFMAGYSVITLKLKEMYQMITLGGDAELELVDSLDPFSEGIIFSVRPPKKSWKSIQNLSGGEKTLSSLALVFALHHYKPTPLYVMDEIDAALDFKNVSIVAHYIKERTKDAQFIIISLRNNMFELADRLVGIYKTDNCTKSVTINPSSFRVAAVSG